MLPSRPSSIINMNVFKEIWISHRSLGSSGTNSKGRIFRFHTTRFVQGIEVELDEHIRTTIMFQHRFNHEIERFFQRVEV